MNKLSVFMGMAYRQFRDMWNFERSLTLGGDIKLVAEYHLSHRASVKRRKNKRRRK